VEKAESDFQVAAVLARRTEPFHDEQCFHCQQSAEKYLKALLEELGLRVPRTHTLKDVLALLAPHHPSLRGFRRGLTFLTRFAVQIRYPGDSASRRQAASALRWAGRVRAECRLLLGLRS
jgi:HEPN domain-containing protein